MTNHYRSNVPSALAERRNGLARCSSDSFAQRVRRMVDEGTLRGASVGFVPGQDWKFSSDAKRPLGIDFLSGHKLLEWSVVNIPANSQCLFEGTGGSADSFRSIQSVEPIGPTPYADAAGARLARIARLRGTATFDRRSGSEAASRRLEEIRRRVAR